MYYKLCTYQQIYLSNLVKKTGNREKLKIKHKYIHVTSNEYLLNTSYTTEALLADSKMKEFLVSFSCSLIQETISIIAVD